MRKRVAGDPQLDGDHTFDDGYPTALIHYSGEDSTVSPLQFTTMYIHVVPLSLSFASNIYHVCSMSHCVSRLYVYMYR